MDWWEWGKGIGSVWLVVRGEPRGWVRMEVGVMGCGEEARWGVGVGGGGLGGYVIFASGGILGSGSYMSIIKLIYSP